MSDTFETPHNGETKKTAKRRFGLPIIILLFIAIIFFSRQAPVKTIDCTSEIIASKPDVVMLGAWWCTYCYQAKKYFQKNEISYCEYDMENTETGKKLYQEHGGGAVPILLIGKHRLKGYSPEQIKTALEILHNDASSTINEPN
jgi:glutaredoxin